MNLLQLSTSSVMKLSLRDYLEEPKDLTHKRKFKQTSTVMDLSIKFHTLVKLVAAENITKKKFRTFHFSPWFNNVISEL